MIGATAFAGGLVAGYLLTSRSGRPFRVGTVGKIAVPGPWIESRLEDVERQLAVLESQLAATGAEFSDRVREATRQVVDQVVPVVPEDPDAWKVDGEELAQDLRFMPRC